MMKLHLVDNLTGEEHKIRRAWVKDGRFTDQVEILVNPESEKGGITSYGIKKVSLREKIEEPGKKVWELRNRYTLEGESE